MENQIIQGDCVKEMQNLERGIVHCVITSPPYNVDLGNNKYKKEGYDEHNDNMPYEEYLKWMREVFSQCYDVLTDDGRMCINVGDGKNGAITTHSDFIQIAKQVGFMPITTIIWNKNNISNRCAWGSYLSAKAPSFPRGFEYILVFGKDISLNRKGESTITKEEWIEYTNGLWTFAPERGQGKVRSSHRGYWDVLTTVVNRQGYNQYLFYKDGEKKNMRGNRLVAEAFIPNPDNLPFVNHKDENPLNDCVENLEWCTHEYNVNYGTLPERRSRFNPKNRPVCMFDVDGTFIREFYNVNDAAKYIGGNHPCVSRACSGQVFCYKGYIWRYKDEADSVANTVKAYQKARTNRKIEFLIKGEKRVFNSMAEAARELHISRDTMRKYNHLGDISWRII